MHAEPWGILLKDSDLVALGWSPEALYTVGMLLVYQQVFSIGNPAEVFVLGKKPTLIPSPIGLWWPFTFVIHLQQYK